MATTYEQLKRQIGRLEAEAEKVRQREQAEVIQRVRQAIRDYGLTAAQLGFGGRGAPRVKSSLAQPKRKTKAKLSTAARYRDESGNAWVGRGPRPHWLRDALSTGKSLEDFAVK